MKPLILVLVIFCSTVYNLCAQSNCGGVERWSVKVLTDSLAGTVNFTPKSTSIAHLVSIATPTPNSTMPRYQPVEDSTYIVTCSITIKKAESDSDFHLVLSNGTQTLIGEIPDPACSTVAASPYASQFQACRNFINANIAAGNVNNVNLPPVTVTGVAFIDPPHGQTGAAPNNLELHPILNIYFASTTATLHLKSFLEGFYTGAGLMRSTLYNLNFMTDTTATDTIQVNLWSPVHLTNNSPDYSSKTILHNNGTASVPFPGSVIGNSYYIAVKHRNSLETWSKNPVVIGVSSSYDFTTGQTQAYSNGMNQPMKNISGVYVFYAGDVSQDGQVDIADMADVDNDAQHFAFGYNSSDCDGNGATDAADMTLIDNNSILFLFFARP
jgi:hypothetical protein